MSVVEIISLRGTAALSEEFCRALMGRVSDQRQFPPLPEVRTYRMKNIESDVSFHLIWESDDIKGAKSAFGISFAEHLKEFGLVSHSVWQQLTPV